MTKILIDARRVAGVRRLLAATALPAALGASAVHAATDMLELRERLEVERPKLRAAMAPHLRAPAATAFPADKPGAAFARYLDEAWRVLDARQRYPEVHAGLGGFRGRVPADAVPRQALAVLLGDYLQVRYGEDLKRELKTVVGFKTYDNVVDRNSENTQMRACFDHLAALGAALGLQVQNHAYESLQMTLPASGTAAGAAPLAIWTHADVPRPIEHKWTTPPWQLDERGGRWYGCGVRDDKGPLLVQMFTLRVLRDAGVELARPMVLLVSATGESAAGDAAADVARLGTPRPALVLAAAGEFPYATGELGRALARVSSTRGMKSRTGIQPGQFWVHRLVAGQGPNTVVSEARAWVRYEPPRNSDNPALVMTNQFRSTIEGWQKDHTSSVYEIYIQDDTLHYFVYGRPEHVQRADRAVNSLYDLAGSILALPLYENSASDVLRWIDRALQRDPTGKTLGLDAQDPSMGGCWANPVGFDRLGDEVTVLLDVRWPLPRDVAWARARVQESVQQHNRKHRTELRVDWEPGGHEPARIAPPAAVRAALDEAYVLASGEAGDPVGATASSARLLPATIPFGPEWPQSEARGHERDESMSTRELQDLGVASAAALVVLGTGPLPPP